MGNSAESVTFAYDAFISYATAADYDLARELEDFLERFHELPTPTELTLRPLSIWRDGSDVSLGDSARHEDIASLLEGALAECRYLVLLWSTRSQNSEYMRQELDWFLEHRGADSILLAVTDAPDPDPASDTLFLPRMIEARLTQRRWYDFRGFRKDQLAHFRRLRDFDEARVQLAADLSGYPPAAIQPLWWRNKVRQEQERVEREERARRRIELAECDARVEVANGWYERAFIAVAARDYGRACTCLLEALAISDPARVPDHYEPTFARRGWAEGAWAFLRYVLAFTPRVSDVKLDIDGDNAAQAATGWTSWSAEPKQLSDALQAWCDGGETMLIARAGALELYGFPDGDHIATLEAPPGAGSLTACGVGRTTGLIAAGTDTGQVIAWPSHTARAARIGQHDAPISAVAVARASATIVSGSADGEIRVWPELDRHVNPRPVRIVRSAQEDGVNFVALMDGDTVCCSRRVPISRSSGSSLAGSTR